MNKVRILYLANAREFWENHDSGDYLRQESRT